MAKRSKDTIKKKQNRKNDTTRSLTEIWEVYFSEFCVDSKCKNLKKKTKKPTEPNYVHQIVRNVNSR